MPLQLLRQQHGRPDREGKGNLIRQLSNHVPHNYLMRRAGKYAWVGLEIYTISREKLVTCHRKT